jgi:hypothetical protein
VQSEHEPRGRDLGVEASAHAPASPLEQFLRRTT